MMIEVRCDCCGRVAFRIIGNTIQVKNRHDGEGHITTIPIADLLRKAGMVDGAPVLVQQ